MTSSSLSYSFGDVGLTLYDFGNGRPPKPRPVVVVSGEAFNSQRREVIVVAPISSKTDVTEFADFQVSEWGAAGLLMPGRVSAAVDSIPRRSLRKHLGRMARRDLEALRFMLSQVFGLAPPSPPH